MNARHPASPPAKHPVPLQIRNVKIPSAGEILYSMIHYYKFKDLNIVLDINSGAVHLTSDLVYDLLSFLGSNPFNDRPTKKEIAGALADIVESAETATNAPRDSKGNITTTVGIIDPIENDILALRERYSDEEIAEASSEIIELVEAGMLYTDDSQVTNEMLEDRGAVIKAMCLHVAHDCNMSCEYCFAGKGSFSGEKSLLSEETGKQAIDFLLENSGNRRNLEIDFFGGEPLMNFTVVKSLVAYGRAREKEYGKTIRFTITTNGLLLDEEKEAFINEYMDNVILSIDGRPEVNDAIRKTLTDQGTYSHIMKNYLRFKSVRKGNYYVRGTFTRHNLDFSEDVNHLADLGFIRVSIEPVVAADTGFTGVTTGSAAANAPRGSQVSSESVMSADPGFTKVSSESVATNARGGSQVSTEPVVAGTPVVSQVSNENATADVSRTNVKSAISTDDGYGLRNEDIPRILEEYDRLADMVLEHALNDEPFAFFHFNIDLSQGPCIVKRVAGCGAGTEYVAVSPEGDIYPCHQFVGEPEFKLGNLKDSNFKNHLYDLFNGAHIRNKAECAVCWAKYYCSGGCHANAWHINGNILEPYALGCELERKRLECAIGIQAVLLK
ncbi:hypothetical protein FACS1894127_1660 [Clostridia bacterium]|nr:hypothetical protein FACS1894127_1660 [Clostridia bacterium]